MSCFPTRSIFPFLSPRSSKLTKTQLMIGKFLGVSLFSVTRTTKTRTVQIAYQLEMFFILFFFTLSCFWVTHLLNLLPTIIPSRIVRYGKYQTTGKKKKDADFWRELVINLGFKRDRNNNLLKDRHHQRLGRSLLFVLCWKS